MQFDIEGKGRNDRAVCVHIIVVLLARLTMDDRSAIATIALWRSESITLTASYHDISSFRRSPFRTIRTDITT